MINLPALAEKLTALGIMDKPFYDCTQEEIEGLCHAVINSFDDSIPSDGWANPHIVAGSLVVPIKSHPKYHYWQPQGQSILDTLLELNAPWEVAQKYLDKKLIDEDKYLNMLVPF